ncbi:MAG: Isoprenyl transferase [Alphaproteobacteria bacterium MarineAlpha5_Bin5]|nr:MAG: Isoprenyl transferase [Alphaproteobacteria bacterium MarineAlpha5_Bin5]
MKNKYNVKHIALILDGNKRWSKKQQVSLLKAYKKGFDNIELLIKTCLELGIPNLTLFTLSSENINRNSINNIYKIIYEYFNLFLNKLIHEKKIKIKVIGRRENLPKKIITMIDNSEKLTCENIILNLNLAFNYGFKNEIQDVLKKIKLNNSDIDLENDKEIKKLFYLGNSPDPEILIRTGGNKRLSNFILYNLTYTELFFTNSLWPEFNKSELIDILDEYKSVVRNYGL